MNLSEAQEKRQDLLFDEHFDKNIGMLFSNADRVGPDARHKLRGLLKFYAKKPHPFTACVRDNTKRFGPGRVEKVCAVLKDIIRGTTKWRGHPELDHGAPGAMTASVPPVIDTETELLLLSIPDDKLEAFMFSAHEEIYDAS